MSEYSKWDQIPIRPSFLFLTDPFLRFHKIYNNTSKKLSRVELKDRYWHTKRLYPFIIFTLCIFIYSFEKQSDSKGGKWEKKKIYVLFTSQMPEPSWSQGPGISCGSPMWIIGTEVLGPAPSAVSGTSTGRWIRHKEIRTPTSLPTWDADISISGLTHCSTTPVLIMF